MARPTRGVKLESRKVQLPAELWSLIDALHHDPVRGCPRYGSATQYFERIVRADLKLRGRITTLAEETTNDN